MLGKEGDDDDNDAVVVILVVDDDVDDNGDDNIYRFCWTNRIDIDCFSTETLPPFESLGCYRFKKNNKKALRTKYIDFRNQMKPENRTWTVHQCARVAHSLGHRYFGVRFFGICYTDSNAKTTYASLGKSTECVNGVGKLRAVMVYVFKSKHLKLISKL